MKQFAIVIFLLLGGCTGIPSQVQPVSGFQLPRYLGTWYEIARLDHSFERGLSHVTASYQMRDDGAVTVVNRGYAAAGGEWKEAKGTALFVERPDLGYLKVSFFGPFYASYIVFELDRDHYQYAMISGPDKSYLWILARTPVIDAALRTRLLNRAAALGFDTGKLVFVEQQAPLPKAGKMPP
jgi:apolipoprotein D and lipocalin family protein